jgi:chemotaxis protein CheY-P-specific phosphatase CheC
MIEGYTIKFTPAVSQKEIEKALNDPTVHGEIDISKMHKMKARIELIGDYEDVKRIAGLLKDLSPQAEP